MSVTTNKNLLSTSGFKLQISGQDYPNLEFYAVQATFPGIAMNEVATPYRNKGAYFPGEKIDRDPLSVRIAMDENMQVYEEIYGWCKKNVDGPLDMRDIFLTVLTSHNNPGRTLQFANSFPISVGSFDLTTQSTSTEYAVIDVSFKYDYFKFI